MRVYFDVLFSSFAMRVFVFHQSTTRFVRGCLGFERLDLVGSAFFDGFGFFVLKHFVMLDLQDEGSSKQALYGLCFAVSPEPSCGLRPHVPETYQSIGRIEQTRQ